MTEQVQNEEAAATAPIEEQKQEAEADQAGAIKLITEKLESSFDEQTAKQLFAFYALDQNTQRLQPPDVRKLLLDLLAAAQWPMVVPDESLDIVLNELCLSEEGSISWIEFKSFFVFLQDNPLQKLLELCTKSVSKQQIAVARLVTIRPVPVAAANETDADNPEEDKDEAKKDEAAPQNYYDRKRWATAVKGLFPDHDVTQIFIYFMDGYQILALVVGPFESPLAEPKAAELKLDDVVYLASKRAFNPKSDMFPPMARSGGLKSKVARRIADSYLLTREWDEKHLKLVEKASVAASTVSVKWTQFDQRFRVQERVHATTSSIVAAAKGFDERHQVTRRMSAGAKTLDEKFGISSKVSAVAQTVASNERVQSVSKKVEESLKAAVQTVEDIGQETQQLVQEKRQQSLQNVDEKTADEVEGDVANGDALQNGDAVSQ